MADNVEHLSTPPTPTRDQKRRIHDEIAGSWDEPKGRYIGNYSDQSIAEALHVPRAWVSEIRADFFGDEGTNEDIVALREALDTALVDVEKLVDNSMELAGKYDKLLGGLKELSSRLARVEKSVLPKR